MPPVSRSWDDNDDSCLDAFADRRREGVVRRWRRPCFDADSSIGQSDGSPMLKIAVIGVGHLGQHHARILASLPDVSLVGVVDTKPGRAEEIGAKYGVPGYTDVDALIGGVDAVSVAVPTVA